jgi:hypothetical protein
MPCKATPQWGKPLRTAHFFGRACKHCASSASRSGRLAEPHACGCIVTRKSWRWRFCHADGRASHRRGACSVVAGFDGGNITSNAGALLLGQVDRGLGLVRRFADCFIDRRDPRYVEHQVETLVGQL